MTSKNIARDPRIDSMLASGAAIALSISGGKDGQAGAIAVTRWIESIGHTGPRILIHADLGSIEWADSLPSCERLARHLRMELVVVRRKAGGMMERFEQRWHDNVERYVNMSCIKVILPWSTPSMRYCTKELKVQQIDSELKKRFKDLDIITVTGVRRDESFGRSRKPIAEPNKDLTRNGYVGMTWNPIVEWTSEDVFAISAEAGIPMHEAYTRYDSTRVSCSFCIMSSIGDLNASANCTGNHGSYRRIVALEMDSGYAYQGGRWLADLRPDLLDADVIARIPAVKKMAARREEAQARIPSSLLYDKQGWPKAMPTVEEADIVAEVRREVGDLMGIEVRHTTREAVRERFADLLDLKRERDEARREKEERSLARAASRALKWQGKAIRTVATPSATSD